MAGPSWAAAGRIAGQFSVNAGGGANYTIPINVPAGMNGLKPNIALVYDSQSGNGLAGMGWTLSGLPKIHRCGKSIALDQGVDGVSYSSADRFCLDGAPLVQVSSGSYQNANTEYRTEIHNYEKITARNTGPGYFEVRLPNGILQRFGYTTDSRIEAPGTGQIKVWALDAIIDHYGNAVSFKYDEDTSTGEYVPSAIYWTTNSPETSAPTAPYSIVFSYENRPADDQRAGYVWNAPWAMTKRLSAIEYRYSDTRVHRYTLAYNYNYGGTRPSGGTGRSQLLSVTQCGATDSTCLPATNVTWQSGVAGWAAQVSGATDDHVYSNAVFGDFDGDGDTDTFIPIGSTWYLLKAAPGTPLQSAPISLGRTYYGAGYPLEFNGDGCTDLLTEGPSNTWYVYESDCSSAVTSRNTGIDVGTINTSQMYAPSPIDIDGDGRHDLVHVVNSTTAYIRFRTSNTTSAPFYTAVQTSGVSGAGGNLYLHTQEGRLKAADFDGDGREDLLIARRPGGTGNYQWEAYRSLGTQFDGTNYSSLASTTASDDALVLDINGDGLSDFMYRNDTVDKWYTRLSTRGYNPGFVQPSCQVSQTDNVYATTAGKHVVVDYDGDGRMDLLHPNFSPQDVNQFRVNLSDGSGCFYRTTNVVDISTDPSNFGRVAAVDNNGDGALDLLLMSYSTAYGWQIRLHNGPRPDLVTGITDGLGNSFSPSYHALSNWALAGDQGYSATGTASAPTTRILRGGATTVVSQYTGTTAISTGTYTLSYAYTNARVDTTGRGFLGFETVKIADSRNSTVTTTTYLQAFPYIGRPDLTVLSKSGTTVTRDDPSWMVNALNGVSDSNHTAGTYSFVHLNSNEQKVYEVDAANPGALVRTVLRETNIAGYGWDYTHGVSKQEKVTATAADTGATSVTTYTPTSFSSTIASASIWCLGFPLRVDISKSSGGSTDTRTVQFSYNNQCQPTEEQVGPMADAAKRLRTVYAYDSGTGMLWSVTQDSVGDASVPERKLTIAYESAWNMRPWYHLFRLGTNDNYGAIYHAWNHKLGLESGRSNVRSEAYGWSYDDFGRVVSEVRPAGSSTFSYVACAGCWAENAKLKITETRSDGAWVETLQDAYGRPVGTATSTHTSGVSRRQLYIYNAKGEVAQESLPYLSTDTPYFIDRTYDLFSRLKTESRQVSEGNSASQVTSSSYNRLSTTTTDAEGRVTTFSHDAEGRLIAVQEPSPASASTPGATTSYGYTPWGELKSITDADGHVTTMSYDGRGFRTGLVEPEGGTYTYEYTVWGELFRMRDPRTSSSNWTVTNLYDELGRLTERTDFNPVTSTSAVTKWEYYDLGANWRGLLKKATTYTGAVGSTKEFEETYTYDVAGASLVVPATTVTAINGAPQATYTTTYTYDSEGRLQSMLYPTTVGGQPRFDYTYSLGYLDTVQQVQGGTTYPRYDLVGTDAWGRETQATLGNIPFDVRHTYDRANSLLMAVKSGPAVGSTATQNLAYTWDRVGNLLSRQDQNQSVGGAYLTEAFSYDALNRLTNASRNGTTTTALTYFDDGRIKSKLMPNGYTYEYSYLAVLPHQLKAAEYIYACGCTTSCYAGDSSYLTYDAAGNTLSISLVDGSSRWINWTAFGKPKEISYGNNSCTGDCSSFTYGPDRQLVKQVVTKGSETRKIFYVGPHFEVEVITNPTSSSTEYRSHALANGEVFYTQVEDAGSPVGWQGYYVLRDHQGSVDKQYRALGAGSTTLASSFDPFGRRRNTDWTNDGPGTQMSATLWNHRGYTDHEMLDNVQMIHMGGRVYDPTLGRFLSPDPVLGDLAMPQTLNPYSYVANNPLTYTDPNGESLKRLVRSVGKVFSGDNLFKSVGAIIGAALCAETFSTCGFVSGSIGATIGAAVDQAAAGSRVTFGGASHMPAGPWQSPRGFGTERGSAVMMNFLPAGRAMEDALSPGSPDADATRPIMNGTTVGMGVGIAWETVLMRAVLMGGQVGRLGVFCGPVAEGCVVVLGVAGAVAGAWIAVNDANSVNGDDTLGGEPVDLGATSPGDPGCRDEEDCDNKAARSGVVRDYATRNTKNWSAAMKSEGDARALARQKLGANPVEVEPGKWRSADGKWQYRAKPGDVSNRHIHLEELNPQTGEVLQNVHLRWP